MRAPDLATFQGFGASWNIDGRCGRVRCVWGISGHRSVGLDARRSGTAISVAPAAAARRPPASRPPASQGSPGRAAAAVTRRLTGREVLAFIATTVQVPAWTGQVSTCGPGPAVRAAQIPARPGGPAGGP